MASERPTVSEWTPKLVQSLRDYTSRKFLSDLVAGVTVGLVALPLARRSPLRRV